MWLFNLFMITGVVNGQDSFRTNWSNDLEEVNKYFIENNGQFNDPEKTGSNTVLYGVEGHMKVFFYKDGLSYSLKRTIGKRHKEEKFKTEEERIAEEAREREEHEEMLTETFTINMEWLNANPQVEVIPGELSEFYWGHPHPSDAQRNVLSRCYKKLTYKELYPGIDAEYFFHPDSGIKYVLYVKPGADVSLVKMRYTGAASPTADKKGNLLFNTPAGDIMEHAPVTFYGDQLKEGIPSSFNIRKDVVSFSLTAYDKTRPLVVDPWTTPLVPPGTLAYNVETDAEGNVYLYCSTGNLMKYTNTGAAVWTIATGYTATPTSGLGDLAVNPEGECFITQGCCQGRFKKYSTTGAMQWAKNDPGGYEDWNISINPCNTSQLVMSGYGTSGLSVFFTNVNQVTGVCTGTRTVAKTELRSMCFSPGGNVFGLTVPFLIGDVNQVIGTTSTFAPLFTVVSSYINTETGAAYSTGFVGQNGLAADVCYLYTTNGEVVERRSQLNGAIVNSVKVPWGVNDMNSGLVVDSCGFIYVGSQASVQKFDQSLNSIGSAATQDAVYGLAMGKNGNIVAAGRNFVASVAINACAPIACSKAALTITPSQTESSCNAADGTVSVKVTGGIAPYTYQWSTGQTTNSLNGLAPGNYSVTVRDASCLVKKVDFSISEAKKPTATISVQKPVSCLNNDGSILAQAMNGKPPYAYLWSNGETTSQISNLSGGTYTVTITDANGCSGTQSITLTAATGLTLTLNAQNATCPDRPDGGISSTLTGGTAPFSYLWSNGSNTTSLSGLLPGVYTLTVTDAKGCAVTGTKTIGAKWNPVVNINGNLNICKGESTILTASGSSGIYKWSTGSSSTVLSVAPAADSIFIVQLTDGGGCIKRDTALVDVHPLPVASIGSRSDALCPGTPTGKATVIVSSGSPPYTCSWNSYPVQTGQTATGLSAGGYNCFVSDSKGCKDTVATIINDPPAITFTVSVNNADCGKPNGQATVTATGGTGTLRYAWNTVPVQNASTVSGLAPGSYSCVIKDANNCSVQADIVISNNSGPTATITSKTDNECFGNSTGRATVTASGGDGPITYLWNTSPPQTTATAINLKAGNYSCVVSDKNECRTTTVVTITEPPEISVTITSTPENCGQKDGTATAVASGGTGNLTYRWNTVPVVNNAYLGGLQTSASYTVTVTDQAMCTKTATVTIGGNGGPSIELLDIIPQSCIDKNDGAITTTITGGAPPYTLNWNTSPPQADSAAWGLAPGTYVLTVTDANRCADFLQAEVPAAATIKAVLAVADDACQQGKGSINATVTGGAGSYKYTWNTTPKQFTAKASGLIAGNYTLTATDANYCAATFNASVNDIPGPRITRVDITQPQCVGQMGSAIVEATGEDPLTYAWSSVPQQDSVLPMYLSQGQYNCRVTDRNACFKDTTITIVPIYPSPVFSLGMDTAFCVGDSINIWPDRAGDSYLWSTGETTGQICVKKQGVYGLTITVNGCSYTDNVFVREDTLPVFDLGKDSVFCGAFAVSIDITLSGNADYTWSDGYSGPKRIINVPAQYWAEIHQNSCVSRDSIQYLSKPAITVSLPPDVTLCDGDSMLLGINTNVANPGILWNTGDTLPVIIVKGPGTYIAEISDEHCKARDTTVVAYRDLPVPHLGGDTSLCVGESLYLSSNYPSYVNLWNTGENTDGITVTQPGIYSVKVSNFNCSGSDEIRVDYRPLPVFDLGRDTIICPRDKIGIGTRIQNGTYSWNTGEQTAFINAGENITYFLTVTRGNCSYTDSLHLQLHPLPLIKLEDTTICPLDTIFIDGTSGNYRYKWENGDTIPVQMITMPSVKTLTVTDTNNCSNSKTVRIPEDLSPECEHGLFVPNTFTPNGDGYNDVFSIQGEFIEEIRLDIYNRWGQLLFTKTSQNPVWDGTYNGEAVPSDVYVWRARVITIDQRKKLAEGKVAVIR